MNIDELKKSSFLRRIDVGRGALVTINHAEFLNVAKEGAPEEMKRCLFFNELEKPLVTNQINRDIIANIIGDKDDDHWAGHKIVLYDDPNIQFAGKLVGGIRVRAPRTAVAQPGMARPPGPPAKMAPPAAPAAPDPEDVPYPPVPSQLRAAAQHAIAQRPNHPDDPRPVGEFMPPVRPTAQRQVDAGQEGEPEF